MFRKFLKITTSLLILCSIVFVLFASPSLADDCGKSDRVDLPRCVFEDHHTWLYSDSHGYVKNNCNHDVTVKVDISQAGDKRFTLKPNEKRSYKTDGFIDEVRCCPRYNSCKA